MGKEFAVNKKMNKNMDGPADGLVMSGGPDCPG